MSLIPQTATRPALLCYISTSLAPLIRSCASAAARMDLFHYLADLLLRISVFKSHLSLLRGRGRSSILVQRVAQSCEWGLDIYSTAYNETAVWLMLRWSEVTSSLWSDPGIKCQWAFNLIGFRTEVFLDKVAWRIMKCCYGRRNVFFSGLFFAGNLAVMLKLHLLFDLKWKNYFYL